MIGYIYKTTNKVNNKIYVGQHKWDKDTIDPNYYGSGKLLLEAIKKYGKENFSCEILEWCETFDELAEREIFWIARLESKVDFGNYNMSDGGKVPRLSGPNSPFFNKHRRKKTQAEKDNISEKLKGHPGYWEGKNLSDEHRKHISESQKGKEISQEQRDFVSDHHSGSKMLTNGIEQHWFYDNDVQKMLDLGWWPGTCKKRNTKDRHSSGNSRYGKTHMYNEDESERIFVSLEEVPYYENLGYHRFKKKKKKKYYYYKKKNK